MTSPPPATPACLELPEEIERAIEALGTALRYHDGPVAEARSALTTAILSRLSAAEAGREEWERRAEANHRGYTAAMARSNDWRARVGMLEKALSEIQGRTGMLLHQNAGRWDVRVEHERRAVNVLHVNQQIAGEALSDPSLPDLKETREGDQ